MKMSNRPMRRSLAILLSLCAAMLVLVAAGFAALQFTFSSVSSKEDAVSVRVEVPSGTGVRTLARMLAREKLVRSEKAFYLAARCPFLAGRSGAFVLKPGVYNVSSAQNIAQLLDMFGSGEGAYIAAVIPEGLTLGQIAAELDSLGVCAIDDFRAAAADKALLQACGIPASARDFEGYLFPDTYFFTPQMTGKEVVRVMTDTFFRRFQEIDVADDCKADGVLSPERLHDIVTLASIVEREYRVEREAPLIASVFANRLETGTGLYSCATVAYVITEILGRPHPDIITYDDLKIDSPYNTYRWRGLPPGPISNPGMVALRAAANPPHTDYFYFTLTDADAGTHTFTETLSSHVQATAQFKTKKTAAAK